MEESIVAGLKTHVLVMKGTATMTRIVMDGGMSVEETIASSLACPIELVACGMSKMTAVKEGVYQNINV